MRVANTRRVDELGRVVLPIELRKELNINFGNSLDVCINENKQIILVKNEPNCKICGVTKDLKEVKDKKIFICSDCLEAVSGL